MTKTMPPHLKDWLKANMTSTHKIWWMRTFITDVQAKTAQKGSRPSQYFRVFVRNIDAEEGDKKGYEFDIEAGKYKDFRQNDRMSLFGHEPIDATHLSYPRFFYNHEIRISGPCYLTHFVDRNFLPITDYIATVEGSAR